MKKQKKDTNTCLNSRIDKYADSLERMNSVLILPNVDPKYVPYTGNGYIGINVQSKQGLLGLNKRALNLPLKYNPLAYVYYDSWSKKDAFLLEFDNGLVHRIQSYEQNDNCFTITNTLFASRTRPSVLIEEINLYNPTRETFNLEIIQLSTQEWNSSHTRVLTHKNQDYLLSGGIIYDKIDGKDKHMYIVIATKQLPTNHQLKPHDISKKLSMVTVIRYSHLMLNSKSDSTNPILKDLEDAVDKEFKEVLDLGVEHIKQEHTLAWNEVFQSAFSMSKSLAPNSLNGDQINSTIYYVLSNSPTHNHDVSVEESQLDRCYEGGFSTLQAFKLWSHCVNEHDISELSSLWYLTLIKNGCHNYVNKGVNGVLQAIILSIGGLKFSNHHLELNLDPRKIHRNYYFHKVNYQNITKFNIFIEVGDDNHAKISVEMSESSEEFYACDAGCLDDPLKLNSHVRQEFPVKETSPLTAILYISNDKTHINELKHILHVHEIDLAPPQDVHSVALHKHGHFLGGLSLVFWSIFIFLIVLFHLFLCKLIYRELCAGGSSSSLRDNSYKNKLTRAV